MEDALKDADKAKQEYRESPVSPASTMAGHNSNRYLKPRNFMAL